MYTLQGKMIAGMMALTLLSAGAMAAERKVSTAAELAQAAGQAKPGDEIIIAPGKHANWGARISCKGSENQPIVIRPETENGVTFTGMTRLAIGW